MVIIALIVLAVVVYFLFFSKKTIEEKAEKELEDEIDRSPQTPSFSDVQYNAFADVIYNSLDNSAVSDNKDHAVDVLLKMEQTVDVLKLIKAYGKRQRHIFGIPDGGKTSLPQTIVDEISNADIQLVNQEYNEKAINFQW